MPGAVIVRHARVQPGLAEEYTTWRGRVLAALGRHQGFLRVETFPPDAAQPDWVSVEHFDSPAAARAWLGSPERAVLAEQVVPLLAAPDSVNIIVGDAEVPPSDVTAVITNSVRPGMEAQFREWHERIGAAQARYLGYRGAEVQEPIAGVNPNWVTLLRFDTAEHLRAWLDSADCARLTAEAEPFLASGEYRVTRTTFASWLPAEEQAAQPSLWKVNAIVLLVLYPVVMLTIIFINPWTSGLGVGPQTFVANVIGVVATGFVLVPWAAGLLRTWLSPPPGTEPRTTVLGWVLIVLGYVGLIAAMSALAARFL